ncbi:dihydroxyacetone kinase subunit DhaK [Lawsonibacter faecis]|uniref:Dihydroxyacetone kinase subunit DhaK n=1 Tax=Lawsonibacter faecis TaxID=2763052 RepID=A0A8J6JA59_9FIRM|nr:MULTISPECIES: dihydroxyacetone kinase subunit DhaK [Oscillospiraceae]MTQ96050.1 dihydroxyacetone kinase [Pseudoflavonifractor sp. BIOML-A16]MTR04802.1 dihydroxyacetone kinase [Pseudoflavonifractor sp. BIOML-A15]MTR30950.1 dihydroxyacetone kinase [Pseudoflavonifractor sp. BIOML-A14]MTR71515.1 dihydroxyacetone kinase [Pseudoflavonifractor sp. BIOML-A18]MTS62942.1 dihydroxyacetone kinase [Pseudoflavonifractor sp. BIOML-A5]MTS71464.1 dihydroxyacetone kinase [Pseudoflavonifractor sp. BIOML-A8]
MTKKILNSPAACPSQMLDGFLAAHGGTCERVPGVSGLRVRQVRDKVALVIGGGSGHEPMFTFFVGDGLADAAAAGNVFASPDPNTIVQTARAVDAGKGVLFVYGNYSGDNLNFDIAAEMLEEMGVPTRTVRVWDDVASAPAQRIKDRRGIAGDLFVIKIAGAATAAGLSLDEAWRVAAKARDGVFSIGVGLAGAAIPGESEPIFTLPEGEIEFGLGIHGEPGIRRMPLPGADELTDLLVDTLFAETGVSAGDRVCTCVNGLGSTTLMELYIMNRRLRQRLDCAGVEIHDMQVGSYVTSQEMAGASISLLRLDGELAGYFDRPCSSPHYRR